MTRSATIHKEFSFEAAHVLPNHSGKCRRMHGHNYEVEVQVTGPIKDPDGTSEEGMVMDFGAISEIKDQFDHRIINEVAPEINPPTAENLADYIALRLHLRRPDLLHIRVTVWETENSWAVAERAGVEPFLQLGQSARWEARDEQTS